MKTFTTTDGTEWRVTVNVLTIKRVLEDTGLKLTDLFSTESKISEFFSDDVKFCEVLWSVVRPEAEKAGKTLDDFFSAIDGTVIESAVEALLSELVDFFQEPRRGLLRKVLQKWRAASDKLKTEGVRVAEQRLEEIDFETVLSQMPTNSASSSPAPAA